MRKIMAVWDANPLYAERLADFANEGEEFRSAQWRSRRRSG